MSKVKTIWDIDDHQVPIDIITESRRNFRASIGAHAVIIRIPNRVTPSEKTKYLNNIKDWLKSLVKKDAHVFSSIAIKGLESNINLTLMEEEHQISICYWQENKIQIKQDGSEKNRHTISIPNNLEISNMRANVEKLLIQYFKNRYLNKIKLRLQNVNARTFQFSYRNVSLTSAKKRWGSCSNSGNINFSARLLLCPLIVIDYVIIHELAHIKEQNHSANFWRLVESVMPNYKECESWLKSNGNKIQFLK